MIIELLRTLEYKHCQKLLWDAKANKNRKQLFSNIFQLCYTNIVIVDIKKNFEWSRLNSIFVEEKIASQWTEIIVVLRRVIDNRGKIIMLSDRMSLKNQ